MFTGLIRHIGKLAWRRPRGDGARLCVWAPPDLMERATPGASVAVMGACLTVAAAGADCFEADLSAETLSTTTLGELREGASLHLEPSLLVGEPLGGHLVSGHVDCVGHLRGGPGGGLRCFTIPQGLAPMLAPKGSVAVDGVSLTVVDAGADFFTVSIIPETEARTALKDLPVDGACNVEADPIGRYVARALSLGASLERLARFAEKGWG